MRKIYKKIAKCYTLWRRHFRKFFTDPVNSLFGATYRRLFAFSCKFARKVVSLHFFLQKDHWPVFLSIFHTCSFSRVFLEFFPRFSEFHSSLFLEWFHRYLVQFSPGKRGFFCFMFLFRLLHHWIWFLQRLISFPFKYKIKKFFKDLSFLSTIYRLPIRVLLQHPDKTFIKMSKNWFIASTNFVNFKLLVITIKQNSNIPLEKFEVVCSHSFGEKPKKQ